MCGIAGIATLGGPAIDGLEQRVAAMCQAQLSRGPDDGGTYVSADGSVGLGNRRLAIRDLSPAGHMPMSNAEGTVWITYNGEIYNAEELRSELETLGARFRSLSDTEVILYGYATWGDAIAARLRGMFAFAIYDARTAPRLFLARDPLGIKPLYYAWMGGTFCFASECRGLFASGLVGREIAPCALVAYLELGSVPAPLTIYRDVTALEAGHTLMVQPARGRGVATAYWSLPGPMLTNGAHIRYEAAVEEVKTVLLDSVRRHLVSDVPLGVFL